MLIRDQDGNERIAYAEDFKETSITLTPQEWLELCSLMEYRKKTKPCVFAKTNMTTYKKLKANPPLLRDGLMEIKTEDTMDNDMSNEDSEQQTTRCVNITKQIKEKSK